MRNANAIFAVGQLIHHKLFDYRGVIVDVDPGFQGDDDWYDQVALTRPPKDKPWYQVLVHNAVHSTYVAERNLEADDTGQPINHAEVDTHFSAFQDGRYVPKRKAN